MGKAFGLILMLIALYVGMTIYTEGIDQAFGGALATHLTPGAQSADAPADRERRGSITDRVRERVTADMEAGRRRRGY
jgi:hypothetical protein